MLKKRSHGGHDIQILVMGSHCGRPGRHNSRRKRGTTWKDLGLALKLTKQESRTSKISINQVVKKNSINHLPAHSKWKQVKFSHAM